MRVNVEYVLPKIMGLQTRSGESGEVYLGDSGWLHCGCDMGGRSGVGKGQGLGKRSVGMGLG